MPDNFCERLKPALLRFGQPHQHERCGAVGNRARIGRRHRAVLAEHRFQLRNLVEVRFQRLLVARDGRFTFALPDGQQGVLVEQVQSGSLAEMASLQAGSKSVSINGQQVTIGGDIITAVNGQAVATIGELRAALAQLQSDQSFTLTVLRNGNEIQITVQSGQ